jgi:hypothetical protein
LIKVSTNDEMDRNAGEPQSLLRLLIMSDRRDDGVPMARRRDVGESQSGAVRADRPVQEPQARHVAGHTHSALRRGRWLCSRPPCLWRLRGTPRAAGHRACPNVFIINFVIRTGVK